MLRKFQKKYQKNIHEGRLQKPEAGPEGGHPLARRFPGAARGWPRPLADWARGATPQAPLWHIFSP